MFVWGYITPVMAPVECHFFALALLSAAQHPGSPKGQLGFFFRSYGPSRSRPLTRQRGGGGDFLQGTSGIVLKTHFCSRPAAWFRVAWGRYCQLWVSFQIPDAALCVGLANSHSCGTHVSQWSVGRALVRACLGLGSSPLALSFCTPGRQQQAKGLARLARAS